MKHCLFIHKFKDIVPSIASQYSTTYDNDCTNKHYSLNKWPKNKTTITEYRLKNVYDKTLIISCDMTNSIIIFYARFMFIKNYNSPFMQCPSYRYYVTRFQSLKIKFPISASLRLLKLISTIFKVTC